MARSKRNSTKANGKSQGGIKYDTRVGTYYNANEQLLKDVASFPYGYPVGERFNVDPYLNKYGTPGIMTIYYTPSFGYSDQANSQVNLMVERLYRHVRQANSGKANYDKTDLAIYVLGAEQIYAWIAHLSRAYNACTWAAYNNKYSGRFLVRALGFDYDDLTENAPKLRAHINTIINNMTKYALPRATAFAERHEWLNSNVFMDTDNDGAQLYAFVPRTFFKVVEVPDAQDPSIITFSLEEITNPKAAPSGVTDAYNGKGLVQWESKTVNAVAANNVGYRQSNVYPQPMTLADIKVVTSELMNAFELTEDIGIMSGDIEKAYAGNLRTSKVLTIDEGWRPYYSEDTLMQIENATLLGPLDPAFTTIKENATGNILLCTPCLMRWSSTGTNSYWPIYQNLGNGTNTVMDSFTYDYSAIKVLTGDRVVNMSHRDVSPGDTLLATSFTNSVEAVKPSTSTLTRLAVCNARTEICEFGLIWAFDYANASSFNTIISYSEPILYWDFLELGVYDPGASTSTTRNDALLLKSAITPLQTKLFKWGWMESFEHHPISWGGVHTGCMTSSSSLSANGATQPMFMIDMDKYTVIDAANMMEMSDFAISTQFNIAP